MKNTPRFFWIFAATVAACAIAGGVYGWRVDAAARGEIGPSTGTVPQSLAAFSRIYNLVEKNYASPVDPDHAIYGFESSNAVGAIPGMLRELDPHSNFFDRRTFTRLRENQEGKYFGVGMRIVTAPARNGKLMTTVIEPMPGSPAFRAGLRPGDLILRVDGKPTEGLDGDTVSKMLKGPKGTEVAVTISREGYDKPLDFTIIRDSITAPSVDDAFLIRPGVAYIRVKEFTETTGDEMDAALKKLGQHELKGLVLDLRGNPGGLLEAAVEVADHFLDKGQLIVYHSGRRSMEHRYFAERGNAGESYPIVVLINHGTASAAEIVAGALQDHDRALVMGETSFGKGLVQTPYPLSEGTGLLLTTAHYYTPSGRLIQRDYNNVSLYDYMYVPDDQPAPRTDIHYTDGGRRVYGGGGITPDIEADAPATSAMEDKLLASTVCANYLQCGPFFEFGKYYLGIHKTIPQNFTADDQVIETFRGYLARNGILLSDADLQANLGFIRNHVRNVLIDMIYGEDEAYHLSVTSDATVQKALDALPQAAALTAQAKKYVASHTRAGRAS